MVLLHKRDWKCCHISANPITVCVWSCIWFVDATVRIKFSIFSEEKSKHTYLIFMWKLNIHQNILFLMLLYSSKKLHKKPSQKGKGKSTFGLSWKSVDWYFFQNEIIIGADTFHFQWKSISWYCTGRLWPVLIGRLILHAWAGHRLHWMKSLTCVLLGVRLHQWSFLVLKSIEKMSFFWITDDYLKEFRLCELFSVFTQKLTFYSHFLLSVRVGNQQPLGGGLRRLLGMGYKLLWLACREVKMLKSMIGVVVMCASGKGRGRE